MKTTSLVKQMVVRLLYKLMPSYLYSVAAFLAFSRSLGLVGHAMGHGLVCMLFIISTSFVLTIDSVITFKDWENPWDIMSTM